jgi:predicted amidophosphoribosyltransferase
MNMMEVNRSEWNSPVFLIDVQCLTIIGILLVALFLFEMLHSRNKKDLCTQCGKKIENSRWKICPVCGTVVKR